MGSGKYDAGPAGEASKHPGIETGLTEQSLEPHSIQASMNLGVAA